MGLANACVAARSAWRGHCDVALLLLLLLLLLVLLEYGDFRHVPQGDKVVREREKREWVGVRACAYVCLT